MPAAGLCFPIPPQAINSAASTSAWHRVIRMLSTHKSNPSPPTTMPVAVTLTDVSLAFGPAPTEAPPGHLWRAPLEAHSEIAPAEILQEIRETIPKTGTTRA